MIMSPEKNKRPDGGEFFSIGPDGKPTDEHLHAEILDNPEADRAQRDRYVNLLRRLKFDDGLIGRAKQEIARQKNKETFARGGFTMPKPQRDFAGEGFERNAARRLDRNAGLINSHIPGRTDKIPMNVKGGSYILPADIVSGIGQGNTMAGAQALNQFFKIGPYGAKGPAMQRQPRTSFGRPKSQRAFDDGGEVEPQAPEPEGDGADIITAGGEYVIPAETVRELGNGDMKHGHETLDEFVLSIRKGLINTLKGLKPPKKS